MVVRQFPVSVHMDSKVADQKAGTNRLHAVIVGLVVFK